MSVKTLILMLGAACASSACWAQAGDQPFDDLEIIRLPNEAPQQPGLKLNWNCDVLLPSASMRYRPGHCEAEKPTASKARELEIDEVQLETVRDAPTVPRKPRY